MLRYAQQFVPVVLALLFSLTAFGSDLIYTSPPLSEAQREQVTKKVDSRWRSFQNPSPKMGVRSLFAVALMTAEADYELERIDAILALAEQMQDRDPSNRTYGNFRWYWGAEKPEDWNGVEFCMQDAALLWMRHRDRLPDSARQRLERLITFSVEGIRRHRVHESYTNIFLMKTWNCIALGENTGRPKLAKEGYAMLDSWLFHTWENGVHEYISPTYYGTDLDSLVLITAFSKNERARKQAEAALRLFWTDIAANWFEPCQRLGGSHSRDYDYLTGHGYLDKHLQYAGWLDPQSESAPLHFAALAGWRPALEFHSMAVERVPRMVRQRWGGQPGQRSAHYVGRSVSLGTAGASYPDPMDKTLTVQFAGGSRMPVISFLMDARNDPFGKNKGLTGGGHMKSLHLTPFLMSVQREREALLLAAISPEDRGFNRPAPDPSCLLSQLVLPREGVGLWIGDEPCRTAFEADTSETVPVSEAKDVLREAGLGLLARLRLKLRSELKVATPNRAFEMEDALRVESPFEVGSDSAASGGKYVWKPGVPGGVGPAGGRAVIPVRVPEAGDYYLLARVLSPTPSEDSFRIRFWNGDGDLLPVGDWHIGVHTQWTWAGVSLSPGELTPVPLPAGFALLEVLCREDGTKIDQIMLTDTRHTAKSLPLDKPLFLRHGDAAAGFRVVHAADLQGGSAKAELRTDAIVPNAMTLTVVHSAAKPENGRASVALWTRVAEGVDDAGFARFRKAFTQAQANVTFDGTMLDVTAHGENGPLHLKANLETSERIICDGDEPGAADALLAANGEDLGREILGNTEPVPKFRELLEDAENSAAAKPEQAIEAEDAALVMPPFEVGEDSSASCGKFVWRPGEPGKRGPAGNGRVLIPIRVSVPGPHYLWGRVQAPTADDDSFRIRIRQGPKELLPISDWHIGVHTTWDWVQATVGDGKTHAVDLPAGVVLIEVLCREDGAKLDQLWVTSDREKAPPAPRH